MPFFTKQENARC